MSLRYLPEHAEGALLALDLARKEAAHLQYTHRTAQPIEPAEMLFRTLAAIEAEAAGLGLQRRG